LQPEIDKFTRQQADLPLYPGQPVFSRLYHGSIYPIARALQNAQAGNAPVLIRIETKAGRGAGKPTSKIIGEQTDKWAFLVKNLGMRW